MTAIPLIPENVTKLLDQAKEILSQMARATEKLAGLPIHYQQNSIIKDSTQRFHDLSLALHSLHAENFQDVAMADVRKLLGMNPERLLSIEEAKRKIVDMLSAEVEAVTKLGAKAAASPIRKALEFADKIPKSSTNALPATSWLQPLLKPIERFGRKIFKAHQREVGKLPTEARMMFGWAEFMLGSAFTTMGTRTLRQVYGGIREKATQRIDGEGKLSIAFEVEPMSSAERVLKGALGTVELATGVGGMGFGLYNAMKPY